MAYDCITQVKGSKFIWASPLLVCASSLVSYNDIVTGLRLCSRSPGGPDFEILYLTISVKILFSEGHHIHKFQMDISFKNI